MMLEQMRLNKEFLSYANPSQKLSAVYFGSFVAPLCRDGAQAFGIDSSDAAIRFLVRLVVNLCSIEHLETTYCI